MKKKYQIIAIISVVALTCWGIGEMALKTGYKVNNTEIILDDYSKFGPPTGISLDQIKARCNGTLSEYKVEGQEINASKYVEGKGQIPAELPGDNYYKAPSGVQKFALYGTNTVGGWIDGVESNKWEKFEGNGVGEGDKYINIMFDGQKLGIAETARGGSTYYIPDDDEHVIRKYVDDDGNCVYLPYVKIWVYATAAGGGGGASNDTSLGGGGGGASGIACIKLSNGNFISVIIPGKTSTNTDGKNLYLSFHYSSSSYFNIFELGGGKTGTPNKGGEGGTATEGTPNNNLIYISTLKGGDGGYDNNYGSGWQLQPGVLADYYPIHNDLEIKGGTWGRYTVSSSHLDIVYDQGGGGASAFPGGKGGNGTNTSYKTYSVGPGGGGGGAMGYNNDCGYGGAGALWILYA